jgi:hypothetical protein
MQTGIRDLTYEERATWGTCPVCGAADGVPCDGYVGIPLGRTATGEPPKDGVHLGRLQNAPRAIETKAVF